MLNSVFCTKRLFNKYNGASLILTPKEHEGVQINEVFGLCNAYMCNFNIDFIFKKFDEHRIIQQMHSLNDTKVSVWAYCQNFLVIINTEIHEETGME